MGVQNQITHPCSCIGLRPARRRPERAKATRQLSPDAWPLDEAQPAAEGENAILESTVDVGPGGLELCPRSRGGWLRGERAGEGRDSGDHP